VQSYQFTDQQNQIPSNYEWAHPEYFHQAPYHRNVGYYDENTRQQPKPEQEIPEENESGQNQYSAPNFSEQYETQWTNRRFPDQQM
jgi:hypothetical protein